MSTPQTTKYKVDLYIGNSKRDWGATVQRFEWKSMVNGGFMIRCKILDHGFDLLDDVFTNDFFRNARQNQEPLIIAFRLRWVEGYMTKWRTAIISDMDNRGQSGYGGMFEFVAVDPISFYLNNGNCSGGIFKGPIGGDGGVIQQVIDKYVPEYIGDLKVDSYVSETGEAASTYWMMRQDPKTFIASLLDWSSSLTEHKTHWIVANGEDDLGNLFISIEESYCPKLEFPAQADPSQPKELVFRFGGNPTQTQADTMRWEMVHDSFLVTLNSKLVTGGISAVSGEYLDRKTDWTKEMQGGAGRVYVKDSNTEYKPNPSFGPDRGYSKPAGSLEFGWTEVMAIPDFTAGELGMKYGDYIDGRPRQIFMSMLNMVMRIKITVRGEPRLYDCTDLGRTQVTLKWLGVEDPSKYKFMDGNWLLYGWHHKCQTDWSTDVYLARLDFDAASVPGYQTPSSTR